MFHYGCSQLQNADLQIQRPDGASPGTYQRTEQCRRRRQKVIRSPAEKEQIELGLFAFSRFCDALTAKSLLGRRRRAFHTCGFALLCGVARLLRESTQSNGMPQKMLY
jgi:hypothetical protein